MIMRPAHLTGCHRTLQDYVDRAVELMEYSVHLKFSGAESGLVPPMRYAVCGGKRLRPAMVLVVADMYGIKEEQVLPGMRAVEYFHAASLILDDLPSQDNATLRRGRPTVHVAFGVYTAQLASIGLVALAFKELTQIGTTDEVKTAISKYCADTIGSIGIAYGQLLDLSGVSTVPGIEEMYSLKTGLGFEASLVSAAMIGNAEEIDILRLKTYAKHIGIAFQLRDDLLDVKSNAESTGKDAHLDESNGRCTMLALLGADGVREKLRSHQWQAKSSIRELPNHSPALLELADYLANEAQEIIYQ